MRFIATLLFVSLALLACRPYDVGVQDIEKRDESIAKNRDEALKKAVLSEPVRFDGNKVILAKVHLSSVKTSLYQPSFSLEGTVIPHRQSTLYLQTPSTLIELLVKQGERVKKGTPLARFSPIVLDEVMADNAHADDTDSTNADGTTALDSTDTADNQPTKPQPTFHIIAPFDGVIGKIHRTVPNDVMANDGIITLYDDSQYHIKSQLPNYLQQYLKIGKTVELSINGTTWGGQISHIVSHHQNLGNIDVQVNIAKKPEQAPPLGELAKGRIEYGQLSVGVLVPDFAIVNDDINTGNLPPLDLTSLHTTPHKPKTPIPAHVWVVKQSGRLALALVYVVEYLPSTRRFLVSGITQDSLVVLAPLPKDAHGKPVAVD